MGGVLKCDHPYSTSCNIPASCCTALCCVTQHEGLAVVAHDDDVDAAVQVHLLQSIHQLTDDVVDLPQRVVQLRGRDTHKHTHTDALQKNKAHPWTMEWRWDPDGVSLTSLLSGPSRCPKESGCSECTA